MKIFKSHFWYNKSQRNGILFLVVLIFILQVLIFSNPFFIDNVYNQNNLEILAFQKQIDSLKAIEIESRKPKIYPFNPNYITDYKGEQLGMSLDEIDRLQAFRETGKFINSREEFQKITKISDTLLNKISPYFKFPDWVMKRNQKMKNEKSSVELDKSKKSYFNKTKYKLTTIDINKAKAEDFKTIYGIGDRLSERIIKYRSKLQGFSFLNQVQEVWGIDKDVSDKIMSTFKIVEKPIIVKVNVNTATFKEVLKNPYINYQLCKKIFEFRDEVAELQNISELKNIKGFPLDKYDRIVLYLKAE